MTKIKEGIGKKLWCILLALALAVTMMPLTDGTAYAEIQSVLEINIGLGDITFEKGDDDCLTVVKYTDRETNSETELKLGKEQYVTITGSTEEQEEHTISVDGCEAYIILKGCDVTSSSLNAFELRNGAAAYISLSDGSVNSFVSNKRAKAGICVPTGTSLTIDGNGTLTATGGERAAGIGGGENGNGGSVTINGGNVTATGGGNGAGIGGGENGDAGTVNITGGTVIATGMYAGAGIGGGGASSASFYGGGGGTINIGGGTVIATGYGDNNDGDGAGIGGGGGMDDKHGGSGGNITITGGTITASSGYGAAVGGGELGSGGTIQISGGNIKVTKKGKGAPIGNGSNNDESFTLQDADGNEVSLYNFKIGGVGNDEVSVTGIELNKAVYKYGLNDVKTLDGGNLYFYLPADASVDGVTLEDGKCECKQNNTFYKEHAYSSACDTTCNNCGKHRDDTTTHVYNNSGICTACREYHPAKLKGEIYEIENMGQLFWFAEFVNDGHASANAKLTADINLNGESWTPICETGLYHKAYDEDYGYSGTFDGNGHKIEGLRVKSSTSQDASCGLFGTVSGTIKNLGVEGFRFEDGGKDLRAGVIAGQLITQDGLIQDCYVENSSISLGDHVVGGIAGCVYEGTVENCYVVKSVISGAKNRYGYIVGDTKDDNGDRPGTVKNCYRDKSSLYSTISTQLGNVDEKTVLTKSNVDFASGEVTWLLNGGKSDGIWKQTLGENGDAYPNFTSSDKVYKTTPCPSYSNTEPNGNKDHDYDENRICKNCGVGEAAVYDEEEDVYKISNAGQLLWFAEFVNDGNGEANGKLMKDIDAASLKTIGIGTSTSPYKGTFDGNGFSVKIELNGSDSVALFPYVNGATVKNLTVNGSVTASDKYAASLVGQASGNVTIEKCISTVEISSTVSGDGTHGGLVGVVNGGTLNIKNCGFTGEINGGATTSCGGLVGWSSGTTNISDSYIAAKFTIKEDGGNTFSRGNNVTLNNCYYLNALNETPSGATQKDKTAFNSGEVTYKLNNGVTDGTQVWRQTLSVEEKQDYPSLSGESVCKYGDSYVNAKPVTITGVTAEDGVYNGSAHNGYTGTPTNANGYTGKYEVKYSGRNGTVYDSTTAPVNAGDYTVIISVTGTEEYVGSLPLDFTIEKKAVTKPAIASKAYTGETQTADIPDNTNYSIEENNGGTNVGSYDVVLKLKDSQNYKWNATEAVNEIGDTITLKFEITQATNEWTTAPSIESWTYGQTASVPKYAAKFGEVTVSYSKIESDKTETPLAEAPTEVGSYKATFTVAGSDNYSGLSAEVSFNIKKKSSGGAVAPSMPKIDEVTSDKTAGTTTSDTEIKIEEKTDENGNKETTANVTVSDDNQKDIIDEAKKNDSKEIILDVSEDAVNESAGTSGSSETNPSGENTSESADSVRDLTKVDVNLDKDFVESIVNDTDADLTIKTPFGDKTYTQEELKDLIEKAEGKTMTLSVTKSEFENAQAETTAKAKELVGKIKLTTRSSKTAKGNIKVTLKVNKEGTTAIKSLKNLGYTVKYRYYRSTKKASKYVGKITKTTKTFTNTKGTKGTKYYYKARVQVYDADGKLVAQTALKQCKYATRIWTK